MYVCISELDRFDLTHTLRLSTNLFRETIGANLEAVAVGLHFFVQSYLLYWFLQAKRFVAELSKLADREYNSLFTIERMRGVAKVG